MKEYAVILRPFYREQQPTMVKVFAKDAEEAQRIAFSRNRGAKETLDAKPSSEVEWNDEMIKKYWSLYR